MKTQVIYIPSMHASITYFIGENAQENDKLIDEASPNDIWFHVYNKKSCHVVAHIPVPVDRKNVKYIVSQGAVLCKQFSYPSEKNLPILFTRRRYIEKTDVPGLVFIPEENKSIKTC
uniref:NFACT RNA-binding domain-containing protein n=1 Tax=viral metagenome TaxID=1070528 RepID=A0A6C0B1W2_9ZZZZ